MPLEASRLALETALKKPVQAETLMPLIKAWQDDYKRWEAADRFLVALREGRMTIRQAAASWTYDDRQVAGFTAGNVNVGSNGSNPGISTPHCKGKGANTRLDCMT